MSLNPEFTRERLFEMHSEICERALTLMKKKNADYSKSHPLGNFMVSEAIQACSAENGIMVRITDKLSRLVSILEKGAQVTDESVTDTIVDMINYSVLLAGVIEMKSMEVQKIHFPNEPTMSTVFPGVPAKRSGKGSRK